jgi:hypothetical protein
MKIRIFFLFSFLILTSAIYAQELNQVTDDTKSGKEILIGFCNRDGLQTGDFASYYKDEYKNYDPNREIVEKVKQHIDGMDIMIVLGTWCHDSKEQVPRFFSIMDKIEFEDKKITMICIDRDKKAGEIDIGELGIERVPTFIFYREKKEIGRITETPEKSLEEDMLLIIQQ